MYLLVLNSKLTLSVTNTKVSIEVHVASAKVLAASDTPPFEVTDDVELGEDIRLRHRYLDLRRPTMQRNLLTRALIVRTMRRTLEAEGFIDV